MMIQKEFLDRIAQGVPACPGVVGARNSAAIAIASAEAAHTGKPVAIPPCPDIRETEKP